MAKKQMVDLNTLWRCETCFYDHYGKCTNERPCENHDQYRPAYSKLVVVDAEGR